MAEVVIDIRAEDRTSEALGAMEAGLGTVLQKVEALATGFDDIDFYLQSSADRLDDTGAWADALERMERAAANSTEGIADASRELEAMAALMPDLGEFDIRVDFSDLSELESRLYEMDDSLYKVLVLDAGGAVQDARDIKAAIDEIPDITYKNVVVVYETQASPRRPFSEGMDYIEERMASLPAGGEYKVQFDGVPAVANSSASPSQGGSGASFAATINVNGADGRSGARIAEEIDRELALRWRYNRSELRRAAQGGQ